jgi:hypothetical protein
MNEAELFFFFLRLKFLSIYQMAELEDDFEFDEDLVEVPVLAKHVKMIKTSQAKRESSDLSEPAPGASKNPRKKKVKVEFQPLLPPVIASDETDAAFRLREFLWTEFLIYHKSVKKTSSLEIEELEEKRWKGMLSLG